MMALFNFIVQKVNDKKKKMQASSLPLSEGKVETMPAAEVTK